MQFKYVQLVVIFVTIWSAYELIKHEHEPQGIKSVPEFIAYMNRKYEHSEREKYNTHIKNKKRNLYHTDEKYRDSKIKSALKRYHDKKIKFISIAVN